MIYVNPRSSKAKNRLANEMNNDPRMEIEQINDTHVFAVSVSGSYSCWIQHSNDPHFDYLHTLPEP